MGGLVAAMESGFMIPAAGGDAQWMRENWAVFKEKADAGEQEFVDLVEDARSRGLVEDVGEADKREQKRIEEMLGWGDAA